MKLRVKCASNALHPHAAAKYAHIKCTEMHPIVWFVRPGAEKTYFLAFSRIDSHTLRIWCPYWSLIAMATSDFPCSLGPVLSLPNQNETFVKIPSGSTYSTHYDELTLHRGENDGERETPPSYLSLSAVKKWEKRRHLNGITICTLIWTEDNRQPSSCQQAFLSLFYFVMHSFSGWKNKACAEKWTGWQVNAKMTLN